MKRNILVLAVIALAFTSCKKDESADQLIVEEASAVTAPENQQIMSQEALIADAKSKPLTNLVLSENHWDFKDVKKGESVEHIYEVTNMGENPLIISQVKPGCGCTAPAYTTDPIMPGEKGQITLKFDSSNFDGLQNKQAEVYANVEQNPIVLTFSANVVN